MFWRQKWTEAAGDIRVILCSCSGFRNVMKWERRRDSSTFTALDWMEAKKREAVIERKPTDIQSMNWFDRENLSERKKKDRRRRTGMGIRLQEKCPEKRREDSLMGSSSERREFIHLLLLLPYFVLLLLSIPSFLPFSSLCIPLFL